MTGNSSILITGGLGNLGSWLTSFFVEKGYDVAVLGQREKPLSRDMPFEYLSCNIIHGDQCASILGDKDFDFVIHTASANDTFIENYAEKALLVNALGTRNILAAVRKQQLQNFVYISTFHVYGVADGVIDESANVEPKNDYASTHLFAEYYVKQFGKTQSLPFTILRLTNSYGCPKDSDSSKWYLLLNDLAKMAFEKKEIVLNSNGKAQRDFIWMGTVCKVIEDILSSGSARNDIYNLGNGQSFRLIEIAREVQQAYAEVYGRTLPIKINEDDKNEHVKPLTVKTSKLTALVPYTSQNMFRQEAKNIFRLLEQNR